MKSIPRILVPFPWSRRQEQTAVEHGTRSFFRSSSHSFTSSTESLITFDHTRRWSRSTGPDDHIPAVPENAERLEIVDSDLDHHCPRTSRQHIFLKSQQGLCGRLTTHAPADDPVVRKNRQGRPLRDPGTSEENHKGLATACDSGPWRLGNPNPSWVQMRHLECPAADEEAIRLSMPPWPQCRKSSLPGQTTSQEVAPSPESTEQRNPLRGCEIGLQLGGRLFSASAAHGVHDQPSWNTRRQARR
jgi:hypothetical protein